MYLYRYNNAFYLYTYVSISLIVVYQYITMSNNFRIRKQQKNIITVKIVDERVSAYDENDFIDENKINFKGVYQKYL